MLSHACSHVVDIVRAQCRTTQSRRAIAVFLGSLTFVSLCALLWLGFPAEVLRVVQESARTWLASALRAGQDAAPRRAAIGPVAELAVTNGFVEPDGYMKP